MKNFQKYFSEPNLEIVRLYIIGNGFDLKHNLPTKYSDFANHCKLHNPELFNSINTIFPKITLDSLWSNFEEGLGLPSIEEIRNCFDAYEVNPKNDILIKLISDLKDAIKDWIVCAKKRMKEAKKQVYKDCMRNNVDYFLTFNYTDTLETVYNIDKHICHAHDFAEGDEESSFAAYIIGHNQDKLDLKEYRYIEGFEYYAQDFFESFKKFNKLHKYGLNDPIEKVKSFIEGHCFPEIVILGHSLGKIDDIYFKMILEKNNNAKWYIDFKDNEDKLKKIKNLARIGIKNYEFIE